MRAEPRCCREDPEYGPCKGDAEERYSLGIYAGIWCDEHWDCSGYRKEGRSGFDPADAGESYEPDYGPGEEPW